MRSLQGYASSVYAYPSGRASLFGMLDRQREPRDLGGLWRDVLNFLGDREITPALNLPLADAVLPKRGNWTYFLGHVAAKLKEDQAELEADVTRARLGWRILTEQRENLRRFAARVAKHPVEEEQLERWWIDDAGRDSLVGRLVLG
jgi:hypothetical protein